MNVVLMNMPFNYNKKVEYNRTHPTFLLGEVSVELADIIFPKIPLKDQGHKSMMS